MKKILYLTTISSTINAFLVPHIKALISEGNIVHCAASLNKELDRSLLELGVQFYDIPFSRNPLDPRNIKAFFNLIKLQDENKFDIIHVHTPIAGLYGRLLKIKFPKLITMYTAHGFHFYKGAPIKNWLMYYPIETVMAKFTDVIITMNEEDYQLSNKFKINNTYKINGVGLDLDKYNIDKYDRYKIREELSINRDDFVLVMIAEFNKNKNHIQMIKAVEILKKKGINIIVMCAGKGSLEESIKREIKKRKLESNILILGYRNDIPEIISASDAGILLSYREGLPRNIMEIMAYGKPIIGTNIRGIRDLINDRENGILIPIDDFEATSDAIMTLYLNEKNIESMSQQSINRIQKFKQEIVTKQLMEIYNKLYN